MTVLASALDTRSDDYAGRRTALLDKLTALDTEHAKAVAGGGEKYVERHRKRGKLLARERIELLLDPDTPSSNCPRSPPGAATTPSAAPSSPASASSRASSA